MMNYHQTIDKVSLQQNFSLIKNDVLINVYVTVFTREGHEVMRKYRNRRKMLQTTFSFSRSDQQCQMAPNVLSQNEQTSYYLLLLTRCFYAFRLLLEQTLCLMGVNYYGVIKWLFFRRPPGPQSSSRPETRGRSRDIK